MLSDLMREVDRFADDHGPHRLLTYFHTEASDLVMLCRCGSTFRAPVPPDPDVRKIIVDRPLLEWRWHLSWGQN